MKQILRSIALCAFAVLAAAVGVFFVVPAVVFGALAALCGVVTLAALRDA